MKKIIKLQELYVFIFIIVLAVFITSINPRFLSMGNIYSILKSTTVFGILSMGVLLVLISGGIDVSFPVIAAFALYSTSLLIVNIDIPVFMIFILGAFIGSVCGFLNGILIAHYNFPAMVVTLGMSGALAGFMYTFIGTKINHDISVPLIDFGKHILFPITQADGVVLGLPAAYLIYLSVALIIWYTLKYTMFGRSIYALGGDEISAERIGLNVKKTKVLVYTIVGALAGFAGIVHSSYLRMANPFELYRTELIVIASAVLGGASVGGGRGTVIGTFLGLLLVTIINNSLILLGVPSYWQKIVVGFIIILSITIPQIVKNKFNSSKL